jgi:hypothetical protein
MRRVARRLYRNPAEIEPGRQPAIGYQIIQCGQYQGAKISDDVGHLPLVNRHQRALPGDRCLFLRKAVEAWDGRIKSGHDGSDYLDIDRKSPTVATRSEQKTVAGQFFHDDWRIRAAKRCNRQVGA